MSDKKISQLTGATSPLAGTEELPIVQSGSTKKVTVANLTAGRSVSASELVVDNITIDGNTISSTNTNGDVILDPNGTGVVVAQGVSGASTGTVNAPVTLMIKDNDIIGSGGDTTNAWGKIKWSTADTSSGGPGGGAEIGLVYNNQFGAGYKMYIATSETNAAPKKRIEIQPFGNIEFFQNDGTTKHSEFIAASGNLNLLLGNLVIGTAGKGIDFSADGQAAGMTSELLNDYETGTWTPTLTTSGTGFTSVSYFPGAVTGRYTKVGNLVTVQGSMRTDSLTVGSASGNLRIGGLPFTAANIAFSDSCVSVAAVSGFNTNQPSGGRVLGNTTQIALEYRATANGVTAVMDFAEANTGYNVNIINFSATYRV